MKSGKIIAAALLLGLTACLFTGCGGNQSPGSDTSDSQSVRVINPMRDITESESHRLCPHSMGVPEGAKNAAWSAIETGSDDKAGAIVQLTFEDAINRYTARAQKTDNPEADISGMYYDWTYRSDMTLTNWKRVKGTYCRWVGDASGDGYADLCTWYDSDTGISYSLSVTSDDLDGFDLQAIVESLYAPEK